MTAEPPADTAGPLARHRGAWHALILALACLGWSLGLASLPLAVTQHKLSLSSVGSVAVALTCGAVGTTVAWHRRAHPMGWILLGVADFFSLLGASTSYTVLDYRQHHGTWPLGPVAVVGSQSWAPAVVLFGLAFLVYPDGRAPSRRWRWVIRAYLALGAAWTLSAWTLAISAVTAHDVHIDAGGDLTNGQNAPWFTLVTAVFLLGTGIAWLAWLGYQVMAWRRSSGERRQQMKWLMAGAVVCLACGVFTVLGPDIHWGLLQAVAGVASVGLAALPVTIGIGILKFRLYDIDRIVSRTLAYAIVTGLLIGVYAGLVLLSEHVLPVRSSSVAVAGSTLVVAALFNPLRRRVQRLVDRRFNRARYDAERTVAAFAARLQDATDTEAVRADLTATVQDALAPAHLSLWTRPQPR